MKTLQHKRSTSLFSPLSIAMALMLACSSAVFAAPDDAVSSDGSEVATSGGSASGTEANREGAYGGVDRPTEQDLLDTGAQVYPDGVVPAEVLDQEKNMTAPPLPFGAGTEGANSESVIGSFDTRQNLYTIEYPTRAVALITWRIGNGTAGCTGWMIGDDTVMTAGHCVHPGDGTNFYDVNSYTIYPGRDGGSAPYGSCGAVSLHTVNGWANNGSRKYDYGAIKLNCTIGNTVGWFGWWWTTNSLKHQPTIIQGYPGDKPSATQWLSADKVRCEGTHNIYYKNDTAGGMSGSPIWNDGKFDGPYAIGIHAYGVFGTSGCKSKFNSGTRIRKAVSNNMKAWRDL